MGKISTGKVTAAAREYVPLMFGLRIPGFIKIHWRYLRHSFVAWFVLFMVPFIIGASSLSIICEKLLQISVSGIQLFLIAMFVVALAFYFAERFRRFRRIYVIAIPAMVIFNGLYILLFQRGLSLGTVIVFVLLSLLPALLLGRYSVGRGYNILSDGADKDYRPGRDLYMDGQYAKAFVHLERAAKRGHMKSLYLLGDAHEHGNGRPVDRIKAARFYDKSSGKRYGKGQRAFEALFATFSPAEIDTYETDLGTVTMSELF